jgi:rubrerythrin
MQERQSGTSIMNSPVDDATYNLLQALTSKLEAIEAYNKYSTADTQGVFADMINDERRHAERLLEALKSRLGGR